MTEIAPPAVARSGGATSPHSGMVPRPAAPHPQPAGVINAGPPCVELTPARLPSSRGLSRRQEQVVRLYELGYQASEIARQLGIRNVRTVYQHACNARRRGADVPDLQRGSPPRTVDYLTYAPDARAGMTVTAIAEKHGVCASTVSRALKILRNAGANVPKPKVGGRRGRKE